MSNATLVHQDYDGNNEEIDRKVSLPEQIDSISFTHEGGRVTVNVNGKELYSTSLGTRDCEIEIRRN